MERLTSHKEQPERTRKGTLHVPDGALREMYQQGGTWRLVRGTDYDGSVSSVDDQLRKALKRLHGDWRVRRVSEDIIEVRIDAPARSEW